MQRTDTRHQSCARCSEPVAQLRIFDDGEGTSDAGDVEGLGGGHEGDRALCELAIQGRYRRVGFRRIENDGAVDFIGADQEVVASGKLAELGELLGRVHPPGGILWIADEAHAGARRHRRLHRVEIHAPAALVLLEVYEHRLALGVARGGEKRVINRHWDHHLGAWRTGQPARHVERRHHPRQPHEPFWINFPGEFPVQPVETRLHHGVGRVGVAVDTMLDALSEGVDDAFRCPEVHVGNPEREHIGWVSGPLGAPEAAPIDTLVEVEVHSRVQKLGVRPRSHRLLR